MRSKVWLAFRTDNSAVQVVPNDKVRMEAQHSSGVPKGVVWGVQTPPRNSEDIGGFLDRMGKKNLRLDFLLQFTVFSYGCNLLNKGFF